MRSTRSTDESTQSKKRNTGPMRRTVMYAAVIAAAGLFLAGLPVAGTAPAQAQAVQHQTVWFVNDQPGLYVNDQPSDQNWFRGEGEGWNRSDYVYTFAIGGARSHENTARWSMGQRIGNQYVFVYIPTRNSTATVTYSIETDGTIYDTYSINQNLYSGKWVQLGTGAHPFDNSEVSILVRDNDAEQHYSRDGFPGSSIAVDAVAMRCASNCTLASTSRPITPEISGLFNKSIIAPRSGNKVETTPFQISPASATVTASESTPNLWASITGSGAARALKVTINKSTTPGSHRVTVTATNGSASKSKTVNVIVADQKFEIRTEYANFAARVAGRGQSRIYATKDFTARDRQQINEGDKGGVVSDDGNLSQFGLSWIADGVVVRGTAVKVLGDAVVKDRAILDGFTIISERAVIAGNATVSGSTQVSGDANIYGRAKVLNYAKVTDQAKVFDRAVVYNTAKVSDNARVYGNARVSSAAQVYGNARVYGNAKVYGIEPPPQSRY